MPEIISTKLSEQSLSRAAKNLAKGELAIVPTETVYGLAADATQDKAVQAIYTAKGRPNHNPLIIHVSDFEMASRYGDMSQPQIHQLVETFWPGPLTLVVPLKNNAGLASSVTAGLKTIAIRCPEGPMAELARQIGRPLAAPSANLSGKISGTHLNDVLNDLASKVSIALDDGPTTIGIESTIVKVEPETLTIMRTGSITMEQLSYACRGIKILLNKKRVSQKLEAPGMMSSHYAPEAQLRLNIKTPINEHAYLAFGPVEMGPDFDMRKFYQLSENQNLDEAANNLYHGLHVLDRTGVKVIDVAPIGNESLGLAINDRLSRAAAPRN